MVKKKGTPLFSVPLLGEKGVLLFSVFLFLDPDAPNIYDFLLLPDMPFSFHPRLVLPIHSDNVNVD
jgi:hypothetical protein